MSDNIQPARAGKKLRALIIIGLFISIVAGVLFMPAMAGDNEECKNVCPTTCDSYTPWTWNWVWCKIFNPCYNTCHIPTYDLGQ